MTRPFTHDSPGVDAAEWRAHPSWGRVPLLDLLDPEAPCARLVVLAAHPDDESLGVGGLVAAAHHAAIPVELVLVTAGEGSHPDSPTTTPAVLARRRLAEIERAVAVLAPTTRVTFLDVADGGVAQAQEQVVAALVTVIGDGRHTLVAAPYHADGHPDHDACGRAAAVAVHRTGARLVEYPIWLWHHASPDSAPWHRMRRTELDETLLEAKRAAIAAHSSQVQPLSDQPGDEVLLGPALLAHFAGPDEHLVVGTAVGDDALDRLHRHDADPWGVTVRWYEQRKRALTLAALPHAHYHRALEVGCSVGVLAEQLATRCDELIAVDSSPVAVEAAEERLREAPTVHVAGMHVPREWPVGRFDLVVVSEIGYFLSPTALDELVARIDECLAPGGVVLLCHWRHPIQGWVLDGPAVHDRFRASVLPPELARYVDRDVEISVLCPAPAWPPADE